MNNRRKKMMVAALLATVLLVSGCSQAKETVREPNLEVKETAQTETANPLNRNTLSPREQGLPDIYGTVKGVLGNEVTLALAEPPSEEEMKKRAEANQGAGGTPPPGVTPPPGATPGMGGGMGGAQPGGIGGSNSIKLTGETKTLMIPVGIPITSIGPSGFTEVDLGDIVEGSLMQVWLDPEHPERIEQIRILKGR